MLNYKEMILSTTLAMAIIAPTAVYASPINAVTPNSKMKICEKDSVKSNCKMDMSKKKENLKCNKKDKLEVLAETYDETLQKSEKIVPGTASKGEAVLNQRKELKNQINDIGKEKTQASILPLKAEFKAQVAAIEQKLTKGLITDKEARDQLMSIQQVKIKQVKNIKDQFENKNKTERQAIKVNKEAVNESFKNFATAVKAKDAKTIKSTFNIYVQDSKNLNDVLSNLVSKLTA